MTDPTKQSLPEDKIRRQRSQDYELVDVYVSYNPVEAQFIRDILTDNGIECFVRNLAPSQFPISVGKHGENRVTVPNDSVDAARTILREAIAEGALSGDGSFGVEEL